MSFAVMAKTPIHTIFGRPNKTADVGIELEIEGHALPGVPNWQTKSEGSLQNGTEYISKPIKAEAVKGLVDGLAKNIKSEGGTIKESYRCSTHIHVNALPETLENVLGLMVVFTMFEPLLLALCGPQRDGNLFCMSSFDTGDTVSSFETLCEAFDRIKERGWGYERGKYSSLNTGRLADLGTVEARCFPLSVDGTTVSMWVDWMLAMKDLSKSQSDKTYRELWKNVRQNPVWYAVKVFGPIVHQCPNASSLVDIGTETAYELTKILKKYHARPAREEKAEAKTVKKKGFGLSEVSGSLYTDDIPQETQF